MNDSEITCSCKKNKEGADPAFWLTRLESAAKDPIKPLKTDSAKLTLKTRLEPWGTVCLQDMKWRGLKKILSFFRKTPGRVTWDLSSTLVEGEIPVVEQLLYLEISKRGVVTRTYQVSRWLEGYNLGEMARKRTEETEKRLIALLEKAVLVIARLHNAGFVHGDLKWSNFLYVPDGQGLVLTDLDHVKSSLSPAAMGKDLARFILSAAEFGMTKEVEERLIEIYSGACNRRLGGIRKSLYKRLARKRERYAKRGNLQYCR